MKHYKTQMEAAKKGIITPEMMIVAEKEQLTAEYIMQKVACGEVAIPCNINHKNISPEGVGSGLKTKVNVNLGVSGDFKDYEMTSEEYEALISISKFQNVRNILSDLLSHFQNRMSD